MSAGAEREDVVVSQAETIRTALACGRPRCPCGRPGSRTHCPVSSHGRGRGDQNPSLDITERAGRVLFFCRAECRQPEVLDALQARALWSGSKIGGWRRAASVHDLALNLARRQPWARPGVLHGYRTADAFRIDLALVDEARRVACEVGPSPDTWEALAAAAAIERLAHAALVRAEAAAFGEARGR